MVHGKQVLQFISVHISKVSLYVYIIYQYTCMLDMDFYTYCIYIKIAYLELFSIFDNGRTRIIFRVLFQVFTTWSNRSGSATVPVDSSLIHQLKRLARLLHFCSSPLLLCPTTPATSPEQTLWFNSIRDEILSLYIRYLKTLNFEEITERVNTTPPSRPKERGGHTPSWNPQPLPLLPILPQKFYKCLQRSWTHGIILIELTFREERFDVKILTLESSRLATQKSYSPEVYNTLCIYGYVNMYI